MALLYATSFDRPLSSGPVQEDIREGSIVTAKTDGVYKTVGGEDFSGIVVHTSGDVLADTEYDYVSDPKDLFTLKASEGDYASYAADEDGARIHPKTIGDNGTDPAPSISHMDVIGVANVSGGSGDVVQAGYTDNAATQYGNGGAGEFTPIGHAVLDHSDSHPVNEFDYRLTCIVDKSL